MVAKNVGGRFDDPNGGSVPMRRLGAFLLVLGLASVSMPAANAADPAPEPQMTSVPWYRYVFLGERSKPIPPKPLSKDEAKAAAPKPMTREAVARALQEEQRVYLQRLAAISKIRQIAEDTNDKTMLRKADELERQAEEVYQQRTAKLPGVGPLDDRELLESSRDDKAATAEKTQRRRPMPGDKR
jgi:type IV secretory pathway VirB10-like protein